MTQIDEKLKPCPFCGNAPQTKQWVERGLDAMRIYCDECSVRPMVQSVKSAAVETWNMRYDATPTPPHHITVTIDTRTHKVVPLIPDEKMLLAGFSYADMIAAAPEHKEG